jgi:metallophosphoesterase (TIGR00282 family)
MLKLLFIGDIVGRPGRDMVMERVPRLRQELALDFVIANAENVAAGAGITGKLAKSILESGVDAITLGDHIYKKKEIAGILQSANNIVKPANFPPEAPGKDFCFVPLACGYSIAVISLLGRVFMRPVDCPFHAADRVLAQLPADCKIRLCDFHAEATSDKQSMGRYLDGRVSAVLGTHTHVPTADECILPKGTAFQCDVGMTGPYESILGRQIEPVLNTTFSFDPNSFHVASDDVRLSGTWFDVDPATGRALQIGRLQLRPSDLGI